MLTVSQITYGRCNEVVIGDFNNFKKIYDHFGKIYGKWSLENKFSSDPFKFYVKPKNYFSNWGISAFDSPEYCFIIRNHKGLKYSQEFIIGEFRKFRKDEKIIRWNYYYGSNKHHRSCFRHPKTIQERIASVSILIEEDEPTWRSSRNFRNLPSSYDDIPHLDANNRNWKRFRKTQWK